MKKRSAVILGAGLLILLAAIVFAVILSRERLRRHRVFRVAPGEERAPEAIPPVDQWTETFQRLEAEDLDALLDAIAAKHPDLYSRYSLGYLHARALIEENELSEAALKLRPFLERGNRFRSLALYHQAEIEEAGNNLGAASTLRQELIFSDGTVYRYQAIDEEAEYLSSNVVRWVELVRKVSPTLDTSRRRDLSARVVEAMMASGDSDTAFVTAIALLEAERPRRFGPRQSDARSAGPHLAYDSRATRASRRDISEPSPLRSRHCALSTVPLNDDRRFALGRCHFGAEKYEEAQQVYMTGANATKDMRWKATFLFHASRAAQLRGEDAAAERLMTAAIAVKGKFPATTAALTQRLRTRIEQKRLAEAAGDLQLLRKIAGNESAFTEGALAYALGMLGTGNTERPQSQAERLPAQLSTNERRRFTSGGAERRRTMTSASR